MADATLIRPTRRGFLRGGLALLATPAIVRAASLDFVPRAPAALEINRIIGFDAGGADLTAIVCRSDRRIMAVLTATGDLGLGKKTSPFFEGLQWGEKNA